jgi:soluble lytic murein transglycosylase-like protein
VAVLAGCGGSPPGRDGPRPAIAQNTPPAADAALPGTTSEVADALSQTTRRLEADVRGWLRTQPGAGDRPPETVTLYALYQQRLYRYLRKHPAAAARVIAALPSRQRLQARDNFAAGRSLLRLAPTKTPKTQPPIRVGDAEAPGRLLRWYRQAERRFGVRWQILAAVNFVESGFNRLRNNSYAGAQGPMQFVPSTWRAYGLGGNVRDPRDAILGAANYLHTSGAPGNDRRALFSYNPSPLYVDAIMRYARQMQRRPERFYAYWSWQVFVRTRRGEKRLTGPGRRY